MKELVRLLALSETGKCEDICKAVLELLSVLDIDKTVIVLVTIDRAQSVVG
jgi:hypothetical protein